MAVQEKTQALPHWDVSQIFPSLDSKEFETAFASFSSRIAELRDLVDAHDVRGGERVEITDSVISIFNDVVSRLNALLEDLATIRAFVHSFVATDTRSNIAQAKVSELQIQTVQLSKLGTRFEAWVGALDVEKLIERSKLAAGHAFAVRKTHQSARYQMAPGEEDLYSDLQLTGGAAWSRLHSNVTSQLTGVVRKPDGSEQELPMSAVRGLAHDPDEAIRKAAFETELNAWQKVAVPIAAALNSIKGEVNTVASRRGWKDPLEAVLFRNNTDRQTLEAMQQACVESFPDFWRYLKAKAQQIGKPTLAWWDLFAPVGGAESQKRWSFSEATEFIVDQFGAYSDRLANLADRAFRERWVDAEPRLGKVDGAFCMWIRKGESRVLSNFEPSFDSVHTLAHELGHAYHNLNLSDRTPMNRDTPMALAETASIFCQTIITNAALSGASDAEKLSILENELQDACQVVVDIHSRFLFEKGVFEGRQKRELSVDEFKELMLDAQRQTYGEGLDAETLHPFMWVVKGHYYGSSYYNWPYTFGLLFGLGLYAQYRSNPDEFRAGYDDLLSSTGLDDAAALTGRFGFDIRTVEFWRSSLDLIRERVAEFEGLAKK